MMRCTPDGEPLILRCCADHGRSPCQCLCHDGGKREDMLIEVIDALDLAADDCEEGVALGLARARQVVARMLRSTDAGGQR